MPTKPKINPNPYIGQLRIIDILNRYLDWHNLPLRMNREGICNGLAAVYAKYVLEGRQEKFRKILNQISTMTPNAELNSAVNHFVTEIALSYMPETFDKDKNQIHAVEFLQIDGQQMKSSFDIGLVTSDKNWATIIESLDLKDNEVMLVRSPRHAISITKIDKEYVVYDPNYSSGFKKFSDEKKLIEELHNNVFHFISPLAAYTNQPRITQELSPITGAMELNSSLGMHVQIIRHPSLKNTPREFPDVKALYKQYLDPSQTAKLRGGNYDSLHFAITLDNVDVFNELCDENSKQENFIELARKAMSWNSTAILNVLLTKIPRKDDAELKELFLTAFMFGRKEAFEVLLKNNHCSECFNVWVKQEENADEFIKWAAFGGNTELLQQLIEALPNKEITKKILRTSNDITFCTIKIAVQRGALDSVKLLLTELDKASCSLNEKQLFVSLIQSIQTNQPLMVSFFVEKIKTSMPDQGHNIFNSIKMSTTMVERSDLSILRKLKSCHVNFSETAEGIINIKENRSVGYLLPIGIMLNKFTDFIKETFLKHNVTTDSIKKFKELKALAKEIKPEVGPEEPISHAHEFRT